MMPMSMLSTAERRADLILREIGYRAPVLEDAECEPGGPPLEPTTKRPFY